MKLGEILVADGLITNGQMELALQLQKTKGDFFGDILVQKAWITESQLIEALSKQFEMPYSTLDFEEIDWNVPGHYMSLMTGQLCFPCAQDSASVTVAISNPLDALTISQIDTLARGRTVQLVLATRSKIKKAVDEFRRRCLTEKGKV